MSVEDFLQGARDLGAHESSGEFTIGWNSALEKLRTYKAVAPVNHLMLLVSAGCAYGARTISVSDSPIHTKLTMHECYVPQEQIRSGFQMVGQGSFQHEAFDLASGLNAALQYGYASVEICSVHPENRSYNWKLRDGTEEQTKPLQSEEKVVTTIVLNRLKEFAPTKMSFWRKLLFGKTASSLGGFVGLSEPARIVDKRCDYSDVNITINRTFVNRPYHFARAPIAMRIGEVEGVKLDAHRILQTERPDWSGALAFQAGPMKAVVHGVVYQLPDHAEVTGIVWVKLNRDLSRGRVVEDERYQEFLEEIQGVVKLMQWAEDEMLG